MGLNVCVCDRQDATTGGTAAETVMSFSTFVRGKRFCQPTRDNTGRRRLDMGRESGVEGWSCCGEGCVFVCYSLFCIMDR